MMALDFAIFGGGYGMSQPYFDGKFYWLVDTANDFTRDGRRGRFYRAKGWLGCQLQSTQWFHPLAGERRILNGREYCIFQSSRRWLRVETTWRLVELDRCQGIDEQNALIRQVLQELDRV